MDFVGAELREIADAVDKFSAFVESQWQYGEIDIEWPQDVEVKFTIQNKSGEVMGTIGYTDSGIIAFEPVK